MTLSNNNDADEYERIFQQYLEICKQAIKKNKNQFPYTEIWGSRLIGMQDTMKIEAVIYDDRPKLAYVLQLTKDMEIQIVEKKMMGSESAWPFTYQYLKRVVDNPQAYIESPAKLEWGWLKNILAPI